MPINDGFQRAMTNSERHNDEDLGFSPGHDLQFPPTKAPSSEPDNVSTQSPYVIHAPASLPDAEKAMRKLERKQWLKNAISTLRKLPEISYNTPIPPKISMAVRILYLETNERKKYLQ